MEVGEIKNGKLWTVDGSFFTRDVTIIAKTIESQYVPGKQDYTIRSADGELIALAQINTIKDASND